MTVTYTLNPEAVWHNGDPITVADWQRRLERRSTASNPEFQVVTTEGYDLITSVEQGADEFEVIVTFCEPYPDYEALFSELVAGRVGRRPGDVQHRLDRPDQQRLVHRSVRGRHVRRRRQDSSSWCRATRGGATRRCSTRSSSR